jgi:hypothetical protein
MFPIDQIPKSSRQQTSGGLMFCCEQRSRDRNVHTGAPKWDWEDIVAHIEGPRPESWRDWLWLLMTAAGVVLLVCAALAI